MLQPAKKEQVPMFLSKHPNGNYYLWFMNDKGKRQHISTRSKYKAEAIKFFQAFKKEDYERKHNAKRKLVSQFLLQFLDYANGNLSEGTIAIYKAALRNFIQHIGDYPLSYYTPEHFDRFKSIRLRSTKPVKINGSLEQKPLNPVTIHIELRALRAFFNLAVRWKILETNPCDIKLPRIPQKIPTYLTKDEFQKLLNVIEEHWLKEIIVFTVSTGLRRAEITNLKWQQVNLDRKLLYIESTATFHTKAGRMRILPLNNTAVNILLSKQGKVTSDYVFTINGLPIFPDWITHLFKRYVRIAKLSNQEIHFHSLRHTFASWLAQDGVSVYVIKDFLGHSDVKTTSIYSHLQPENLHSEVNRISISMN
jgi:integrase